MPTLRQLRYFARVVETGSMTRAAELLNVVQPALGLQVRQLEEELGVSLLQRHSRGVVATPAGERLCERAREILLLVERACAEASALGPSTREEVALGLPPAVMRLVGAGLMVRARHEPGAPQLRLVEEMGLLLLDALNRRELDLALSYDVAPQPGLACEPWMHEELLLVTAPPPGFRPPPQDLAGTVPLARALELDLVLTGRRDPSRRVVEDAAAREGLTVRIGFEVQSVQAMRLLVMEGLAGSIMPFGAVVEDLRAGRMAGWHVVEPALSRTIMLVRLQDRPPLRCEAALRALLEGTRAQLLSQLGPLARPMVPASTLSAAPAAAPRR